MAFFSRLQKTAFRRFMDGRPGPWGVVAVSVFGVRTLRRLSKRSEEVVYRKKLEPGESVVISHTTEVEGGRRKRRSSRRHVEA